MQYQLSEIASVINGKAKINTEIRITHVFIDSRSILPTTDCLFFAISGKNNDGHKYINELINKGINSFVVEKIPENITLSEKLNFIIVENSLAAFQQFAAWHRAQFNIPIVGITGSNGKTIIKEWLFYVLDGIKSIARNPKSYNSQVGVPLSAILLEKHHEMGIFEAGISMPGEMQHLQNILKPEIGIFTNIGDAHQENFTDKEQKINEKLKLFTNSKMLIYCSDYKEIESIIKSKNQLKNTNFFTWSVNGNADLNIEHVQTSRNSTTITGNYKNEKISVKIPFTDKASVENAIQVWAFLLANELFSNETASKFESLPAIGMRLELMQGTNNCSVINDSYNSDLNSIKIALDFLKRQNQHSKKCLIISDILQSGEPDQQLYTQLSTLVKNSGIQKMIGIGKRISSYFPGNVANAKFFKTTDEFLENKTIREFDNEAILIKGAREFEFEKISDFLQQKTHRTVLEINLEALQNNLNYFRSLLKPQTKVLVMVKAFSYGSGSYEIAQFLEHQRIDYLGVAFTDEGVALRKAGVNLPIIVMNPEEGSFESIVNYQLEPEIFSFSSMEKFHKVLEHNYRNPYPIHIKIDTGMKRLGFDAEDANKIIEALQQYKYLEPRSVFSHLVASDEPVHKEFSLNQIDKFQKASDKIISHCKKPILRHILNSGGIEYFPQAQFEMVRLGIGLYGISSKNEGKMQNISTLKSHISQIRWVKKEETIGYGRKGLLTRDSKIAILPIGYADGLNRKLSNGLGRVMVNGKQAPIVGNVCMDMCMIDITDIEAVEGNEVIIFGQEIPITELAKKIGTIPYEILTSVSQRVKRVYVH